MTPAISTMSRLISAIRSTVSRSTSTITSTMSRSTYVSNINNAQVNLSNIEVSNVINNEQGNNNNQV